MNLIEDAFGFVKGLNFNSSTSSRIISLIEQYVYRLQKEYIWGKNIQKVRQKRMKKQGQF